MMNKLIKNKTLYKIILIIIGPMISYEPKGYTKETLIKACIIFDNNIKNKRPHIKTDVQIINEVKAKEMHKLEIQNQRNINNSNENLSTPFNT